MFLCNIQSLKSQEEGGVRQSYDVKEVRNICEKPQTVKIIDAVTLGFTKTAPSGEWLQYKSKTLNVFKVRGGQKLLHFV